MKYALIPDFPNYRVSDCGAVESSKGTGCRPERSQREWRRLSITVNPVTGYPMVSLWKKNKNYARSVHRLVAIAFVENPLPGVANVVNHKDCNKRNNRAENLEWVTRKQNAQHAVKAGKYRLCGLNTDPRRWMNPTLSVDDVIDIRCLKHLYGFTYARLKEIYGQDVKNICQGRTWKHV